MVEVTERQAEILAFITAMRFVSKPVYIEAVRYDGSMAQLDALGIPYEYRNNRVIIAGQILISGDWVRYRTNDLGRVVADVMTEAYLNAAFTQID